jgi:hypothetical protein
MKMFHGHHWLLLAELTPSPFDLEQCVTSPIHVLETCLRSAIKRQKQARNDLELASPPSSPAAGKVRFAMACL